MIYSCKDVTLQNRKFSEFIDIDNEELLPGSVDNDTIYLSGYVEGDENNQNIKIKVSQLAEKVATDDILVNGIYTKVIGNPDIVNHIDKKIEEEVDTFIKGSGEEEPSKIDQIIDEAITARETNYATKDDIKNFVSKDDYASKENAGLVELYSKDKVTTFDLTDDAQNPPIVYTAADVDNKINKLKDDVDTALESLSGAKIDTSTFEGLSIKVGDIEKNIPLLEDNFKTHSEKFKTVDESIEAIKSSLGNKSSEETRSLWEFTENINTSLESVEEKVNTLETWKPVVDKNIKDLKAYDNDLDNRIKTLEESHPTDIDELTAKITNIEDNLIGTSLDKNTTVWGKIGEINHLISDNKTQIDTVQSDIGELETNITDLTRIINEKENSLENKISELKDEHGSEIKLVKDEIEAIGSDIGTSTDKNKTIWGEIGVIKTSITENKTNIEGTCDELDKKIDRLYASLDAKDEELSSQLGELKVDVTSIKNDYLKKEALGNYYTKAEIDDSLEENRDAIICAANSYTNSEITKLDVKISENTSDIGTLKGSFGRLDGIEELAELAHEFATNAKDIAEAAQTNVSGFNGRITNLEGTISSINDEISLLKSSNEEQNDRIDTVENNINTAITEVNKVIPEIPILKTGIQALTGRVDTNETNISDIKALLGNGPINVPDFENIPQLSEDATVVAHIENINNVIDNIKREVKDHHYQLDSHSTRLDELTEAVGGYNEEGKKRPCTSAQQFNQKYDIGEWPNNFSEIKDLWSGLYSVAKIVGFDHQDKLPSDPDDRNIITILDGKTEQINQNTERIDELDDKINAFNVAIDTASLYIPGMVSIIAYNDDGNRPQVTETATTAVSIDYFERHKPSSFSEDDDEDTQYHKKGTVYVQYKNQGDDNEQPIVYSKAAIDSKLDEEYSKKDSGLNYNTDGVTFSLGNNNNPQIPQNIENVPIPMNCPAMCVTREGIYVTVFYGDGGVTSPQENNRGWRWVMLGTVPQEFVASQATNTSQATN